MGIGRSSRSRSRQRRRSGSDASDQQQDTSPHPSQRSRSLDSRVSGTTSPERSLSPRRLTEVETAGLSRDRDFEVFNLAFLICHDLRTIRTVTWDRLCQACFAKLNDLPADSRFRRQMLNKEIIIIYTGALEVLYSRFSQEFTVSIERLRTSGNILPVVKREWTALLGVLNDARQGYYEFAADCYGFFGTPNVGHFGVQIVHSRPAASTHLKIPVDGLVRALLEMEDILFNPNVPLNSAQEKFFSVMNQLRVEAQSQLVKLDRKIDRDSPYSETPRIIVDPLEERPRSSLRDPVERLGFSAEPRRVQFQETKRRYSVPERVRHIKYSIRGPPYPADVPRKAVPKQEFARKLTDMIGDEKTVLRISPPDKKSKSPRPSTSDSDSDEDI